MLVHFANFLNGRLQLLIVGQTALHMSHLILAEADLADTPAGIADGENGYGMAFAALALGTARAVADDAMEQRPTEDVRGVGKTRGEAIAFAEGGGYVIH